MPINIPDGLSLKSTIRKERIFALEEAIAAKQHIRPLNILILNLMPTKIETESHLLQLLSKSPLQVNCDLMCISKEASTHVTNAYLNKPYQSFDMYRNKNYDGLILTDASMEQLAFEDVAYWNELCEIIDWSQEHVFSTLFLSWSALAGLYHLYGIPKHMLGAKLFGVFPQRICDEYNFLTNGFDEVFNMPQSRYASIETSTLAEHPELHILAESYSSGPALLATEDFHEVYITGHLEYGRDTLANEFWSDFHKGLPMRLPENYFPDDDPERLATFTWRSHANLLYRNWLTWIYQMTPYDLDAIPEAIHALRTGTWSLAAKFQD